MNDVICPRHSLRLRIKYRETLSLMLFYCIVHCTSLTQRKGNSGVCCLKTYVDAGSSSRYRKHLTSFERDQLERNSMLGPRSLGSQNSFDPLKPSKSQSRLPLQPSESVAVNIRERTKLLGIPCQRSHGSRPLLWRGS